MAHLPPLIQDLGLILIAAAVMTLIFKKLKQPIILGYLVAGFLVSPFFPGNAVMDTLPDMLRNIFEKVNVRDHDSIHTWSEIGVIFMLFGLGLEFSFKKLVKVGKTASITASFEIGFMVMVGFLVGKMLGWNTMDSLFLGAILSMSSTTIIVKAFDELKLKGRSFASIVFGVLIVEDLIAILMLVILSSIALTQTFSAEAILGTSLSLGFFLVLWFIMGIYLLPVFLRRCRDILTDEILLIVSVGLCMMMVIVAVRVGFSAELGAFVMGSILGETVKGNKIEHLTLPVKDLFSAVFFVSVGMRIDPAILHQYFGIILLVTAVTVVGKFIGTSFGALLSGCNVRNSTQAGMSMAQIGEFSFIIATLGMTLGVTSDFLYPIVVAVSAVTTFTTPYLIKSGESFSGWLNARIPERLHMALLRYEVAMTESNRENALTLFWKAHGIKIFLNSIVVIGIVLAVRHVAVPFLGELLEDRSARNVATDVSVPTPELHALRHDPAAEPSSDIHLAEQTTFVGLVACGIAVVLSLPFLWAVFRSRPPQSGDYETETILRLRQLHFGVAVLRFVIGCLLVGFLVGSFISIHAVSGLLVVTVCAMLVFLFSHIFEPLYSRMENRFLSNLTEKDKEALEEQLKLFELAPWDVSLTEFELSQNSPLVAKTLQGSGLRNNFGVTVAMIQRGETRLLPPRGSELLLPFDKIYLIGTDEQLDAARKTIQWHSEAASEGHDGDYGLTSFVLDEEHPLVGKTIRSCGVRENINGLIVGIEREGKRVLNPDSDTVLRGDDVLWLVGETGLIKGLRQWKTGPA